MRCASKADGASVPIAQPATKHTTPSAHNLTRSKLAPATIAHGYVALVRSPESEALLADHKAFALLAYIAMRARYSSSTAGGLSRGQMFMGRHSAARELGMTQGETREATKRLKTANHIGVRTTNKGSIVTLLSRTVFDITDGANNQQPPEITTSQQPANNQPTTTNEERIQEEGKTVCVGAEPPTGTHTGELPVWFQEVADRHETKDAARCWKAYLQWCSDKRRTPSPERWEQWLEDETKLLAKDARPSKSVPLDGPPGWRQTLIKAHPHKAKEIESWEWRETVRDYPSMIRQHLSHWWYSSEHKEWRTQPYVTMV